MGKEFYKKKTETNLDIPPPYCIVELTLKNSEEFYEKILKNGRTYAFGRCISNWFCFLL